MITPEIIDFANHLADLSGTVIRKYFRKDLQEANKQNNSPVTIADNETETIIRNAIQKHFPNHGIIGEEYGIINESAEYKWIIDPIDGTTSFVIGRPTFGTLIALTYHNKPIIGIIDQPITRERWLGIAGQNARLNGEIIHTRDCYNISDAVLCTTSPVFFKGNDLQIFNSISSKTRYQKYEGVIYGGDCYLFGLLALGTVDIIIERGLSNYDFAALVPIVESAGGIITDWNGKSLDLNSDGTILACGSNKVHEIALQLMQSINH